MPSNENVESTVLKSLKLGHLVIRTVSFLHAQGLKPGDQFPLSKFIDALASSIETRGRYLLAVTVTPESEKESLALNLLNEHLRREDSRSGGITLTQLAFMINNALADATDNSGM